jgi:hypothetical protein
MNANVPNRRFFHSFPRAKKGELPSDTLKRGLNTLAFMKETGLLLAPEIVTWDISGFSHGSKPLSILQRRMSFTELSVNELPAHSAFFGPLSLSCDIAKLRGIGATPVIYVPQGMTANPVSQIPIFCVNGIHHTKYVLSQLQQLKQMSDPVWMEAQYGQPVLPNCEAILKNTDPTGSVVAEYRIPSADIRDVLQYVGFNNIPFDHSAAVLGFFLNMFYPTDNPYTNDQLGYYRQREWRLIACDIGVKGRTITRALSPIEISRLEEIDPLFWAHELSHEGVRQRRSQLALAYDPSPGWNLFEFLDEIFVPEHAVERVTAIVDQRVRVRQLHSR